MSLFTLKRRPLRPFFPPGWSESAVYRRSRTWLRRSRNLFLSAAAVAALALVCDRYFDWREARYAREGVLVHGTVISASYNRRAYRSTLRRGNLPICYVQYRFSVKDGGPPLTAWRLGFWICGKTSGDSAMVVYLASKPSVNRPVESAGTGALLVVPLWLMSAGLVIWGVLQRRQEGPVVGSDGFEVAAVVEAVREEPPGHFILTYRYDAGVRGAQFGQCEIAEPLARQLAAGSAGRVRVDPMHPTRSDWLGAAPAALSLATPAPPDRFGSPLRDRFGKM